MEVLRSSPGTSTGERTSIPDYNRRVSSLLTDTVLGTVIDGATEAN